MMLGVGIMVGLVIISMYLPMFKLLTLIGALDGGHGAAAMTACAYSPSLESSWPRIWARNGKSPGLT